MSENLKFLAKHIQTNTPKNKKRVETKELYQETEDEEEIEDLKERSKTIFNPKLKEVDLDAI